MGWYERPMQWDGCGVEDGGIGLMDGEGLGFRQASCLQ